MKKNLFKKVKSILLFTLLFALIIPSFSLNKIRVSLIFNKDIAPFQTIKDEISKELEGCEVIPYDVKSLPPKIQGDYIVTIGLEAYKVTLPIKGETKLIYTMVLNPEEKYETASDILGVAMIPSPKSQFNFLAKGANIDTVTIFYNPLKSKKIVEDFKKLNSDVITCNFIEINSEKELLNTLEKSFPNKGGVLLIPDSTVLTEQGIKKMVIKSYENKVPIIGFSPMYIELGAAMSIYISEKDTAKTVKNLIYGDKPEICDRTDGVCYSRLCEVKFSKKAAQRFSFRFDPSQFKSDGIRIEGVE